MALSLGVTSESPALPLRAGSAFLGNAHPRDNQALPPGSWTARTRGKDRHRLNPNCWNSSGDSPCPKMKIFQPAALQGLQGPNSLLLPSPGRSWSLCCSSGGRMWQRGLCCTSVRQIIFVLRYLWWIVWLSIRLPSYRFKTSGSINRLGQCCFLQLIISKCQDTIPHTFVNLRICFLHRYLSINRREQPAVPKAGWISYYDLYSKKK